MFLRIVGSDAALGERGHYLKGAACQPSFHSGLFFLLSTAIGKLYLITAQMVCVSGTQPSRSSVLARPHEGFGLSLQMAH